MLSLIMIFAQDFRERAVYVWLFIITSLLMGYLYFSTTNNVEYLINIGINLSLIATIIGVLFLYAKYKIKIPFSQIFGFGDVFFFITIAMSFPIATFLVLFSFSLLFSLVIFKFLKVYLKEKSVPLAGLQALFFLFVFSINWSFQLTNLYAI